MRKNGVQNGSMDGKLLNEQAAYWVVQMTDTSMTHEQRKTFEQWLAQSPAHRQVFEQVSSLWNGVAPSQPKSPTHTYAQLGVLLLLGSLYWLPFSEWLADERTATGEIRRIEMADGSHVTLDSNSAIDIAFDKQQRRIILHSGRLLAEVTVDDSFSPRPFIIENRDGTAQALGTRYSVEQSSRGSRVTVMESRVATASHAKPGERVTLEAGQSIQFDSKRIYPVEIADTYATSWAQAQLVFENVPLENVITELARYHKGWLKIDSQTEQMLFTGVLPSNDLPAALEILENALPINIQQPFDWLVWIRKRPV
jgi:transmembrane sensor